MRRFVVRLDRAEQLFDTDPVSPMSEGYTEYTAQPAMDTIRDQLLVHMPARQDTVEIEVQLPPDQVREGLADDLTQAVRRWVQVQNRIDVDTTEAGGKTGWRLFFIGILAFFVLQLSSLWVRSQEEAFDEFLIGSVGEGLTVASWVMLWFPLQMATMEVWGAMIRRRRMRVIERVSVLVTPRS